MKNNNELEINEKIFNLVRFRIHYQKSYEQQIHSKDKTMFCLPSPTTEELLLVKAILGWIFSNLAWDYLKKGIAAAFKEIKKIPNDENKFLSDEVLKQNVADVKASLKDFNSLDKELQKMLKEEATVHCMTDDITSSKPTKKIYSEKNTLIKLMLTAAKKSDYLIEIKFSSKEKVSLKKNFQKLIEEEEK